MHINVYVLTILLSAFIMSVLAFWSWRLKAVPGIRSFSLLNISGAAYAFFYALEVSSETLQDMWFYYRLEYLGISFFSALFLLFAIRFSGEVEKVKKSGLIALFIIPFITLILVNTNDLHGLFLKSKSISTSGPYPAFTFEPAVGYWVFQVFSSICILISLGVFIRMLWMAAPAYRNQYIILVASIAIPFPVYILYLAGMFPKGLDPLPYSYAVGGLIIAFGLTRFGLFRNVPVARNLLFDHIPDPVIVFDANSAIIDCNRAGRKLFGITEKSFGQSAPVVLKKFPLILQYIAQKEQNPEPEIKLEIFATSKYFNAHHVPIEGFQQGNRGYMLILQDITSRREAEILRSETEAKFRLVVENAPLGIFYFDEFGIIQHCNDHFARILNVKKEKIVGMGLLSLPDNNVKNATVEVLDGKKTYYEGEYQSVLSGKKTILKVVALPVLNEKKEVQGGFGIIDDITEAREAQEKIYLKSQELSRMNAEKDRLFSIIAHDLKSPFFTLMGLSDILSETAKDTNNHEIITLTEEIRTSAHSLNNLLDNLLQWSRLKRGLIQIEKENFIFRNLVNEISTLFTGPIKTKNIVLVNNIPEILEIYTEKKMVSAIIRNLISNSIKYSYPGGKIIIDGNRLNESGVSFSVTDFGVGISTANLEKLFKIDQKVGTPGTIGEPSSGFGLLLCMEFTEQLGGKISVKSEVGAGSTFIVDIP